MTQSSSSRVPKFFRRIAVKGWRNSPYFTYSSRYPVLRRWLISQLSGRDHTILSIGCGSGELERDLIQLKRRVIGIDICFEMLQSAQHRGVKNVAQADALRLPFASSAFDLVLFPESIGYFDLNEALSAVASVLKQRGRLLLTAYPTNFASDFIYKRRTVEELTQGLHEAGFRVADQKLLTVKKSRVTEVRSEARSELIYILAGNGRVK
jgi:SAM-dependent methyltransferase